MRLAVCNDRPLRTWSLGFGSAARVVMPASLAQAICDEFDAGRERYTPRLPFDALPLRPSPAWTTLEEDARLPFAVRRA